MADPTALEQDGANFATKAVQLDQSGQFESAAFYYTEAAQSLLTAITEGSKLPGLLAKANEYLGRAEMLKKTKHSASDGQILKTKQQMDVERAQFLIRQAFDEDTSGNMDEAIELYSQSVELCIRIRDSTTESSLQTKVTKLASQALDRAEDLKKKSPALNLPEPPADSVSASPQGQRKIPPLGFNSVNPKIDPSPGNVQRLQSSKGPISVGAGGYSKEEITVLRTTSFINGRDYVPFMSVDMRERFAYPVTFTDKHGMLALSPKQKSRFGRWARPSDFCDNPQMIYAVSSFSIRQTIVSDCSFVASLAISAQYERRFRKKLITSIIYPQNRQGDPVYNPCGKFMVKLNLNGVLRKVIIDDYLPMSRDGELLCSFSNNRNELWVSLLEKAYMKVMGGYDFPGSNSNIDLHALTGWIPERVAIRVGSEDFNKDKEFNRIMERFHKGHCLVTIATGEMSDSVADRAGLVPTHAYAMLDIRVAKGYRMFQLKNPWSHLRWKGNFSENDSAHWTKEMQQLLNYDPSSAQMVDNGVFWIDYDSLCNFFDVIYINWNPELFTHTTCVHHSWTAKEGPRKDAYNIGDNPQFRLDIRTNKPSAVWVLLTRHITDKDDFANNREFITILVYKTKGRRIFYPYDPPPYKDGVRINSPHCLCKMLESQSGTYNLVVSQYEKNNTINYTLRVYATCEFSLTKISEPYVARFEKKISDEWKGSRAGGCGNYESSKNNPTYQIKIDNSATDNHIMVELRGPKQYSVGFNVITVVANNPSASGTFTKISSGDYRRGFCVLELPNISGGVYNVSASTFQAGQEGPFFLNVSSSVPLTLTRLQ